MFKDSVLLALPADSGAFSARYLRFVLVAYFSLTVLNRVFDKDQE